MATITDRHGNVLRTKPDTLEDWKQAAEVEAGIRRELQSERRQIDAALKRRGLHLQAHIDGTFTVQEN